jgi:ABC-2 type transport system ATP-binding protein
MNTIILQELSKSYGKKEAVKSLNFSVNSGEIVGFLGPNGAGKSTTIKMLTCLIRPTAGTAFVAGYDILKNPIEVKQRMGYVPESGALFETLSGIEYLRFLAELHHLDRHMAEQRAEEFLTLFGLWPEKDQRMQEYSKGMKQKVLICAALLHNPEVLFLDEPLNGLDANSASVFKEVLRQLAGQGKTIFFCSHILDVVEKFCQRIMIVNHGKLISDGTPVEIAESAGAKTLEEAFSTLTGSRNIKDSASDFLQAMEE